MTTVRHGDNIYEIGAVCGKTLRMAGWEEEAIVKVHAMARKGNYDNAVAVYRRYITIGQGEDE